VDYRIRGYRPPQSKWTAELTEERLCFHNFEWLATSQYALGGCRAPVLDRRIVKIPIAMDDFALYRDRLPYPAWEAKVLEAVKRESFTAISLHDCYGDFWLAHYSRLLATLRSLGTLRTFDEVADIAIVSAASPRAAA
jgi:hypothetical protein